MEREQVLAFRLARSGLHERTAGSLAEAAACPASDFARDAALLALAARMEGATREAYDAAVDAGQLVVAHVIRGAIHAIDPADHGLLGKALVGLAQPPGEGIAEVAAATRDILAGGRALTRDELHDAWRERLPPELLPWCKACASHHASPMVWRHAVIVAGTRYDARRRVRLASVPGAPDPADAVRRFLHHYGPATPGGFAAWAGITGAHAKRLWEQVEIADGLLSADADAVHSPPQARGVRLLPAGDPYLQIPNRPLLAPDPALRKRLFRPVASPGAVLSDGRLAGLWRARIKGRRLEVEVEKLGPLARRGVEPEAERLAALRGAELRLTL